MGNQHQTGWAQHEDETLISLWKEGKSASEIAPNLPLRTRSSILGRVHRLQRRFPELVRRTKTKPQKYVLKKTAKKKTETKVIETSAPIDVVESRDRKIITPQARRVVNAWTRNQCRWVVGEYYKGSFKPCKGESIEGSSYCETHHPIIYKERV